MNLQQKSPFVKSKTLLQLVFLGALIVLSLEAGLRQSHAQSEAERALEDKIPKHLPLKVKVKQENGKEKAFKDMRNEKWLRDLELEVTNTGDKPIYHLSLLLILPEMIDTNGYNIGFSLHYGRSRLGDIKTKAEAEDIPIKPGGTYVFKVIENQAQGWEEFKREENKLPPRKVVLKFQILSFGDGTGFWGNDGVAAPHKIEKKSSLDCGERELKEANDRSLKRQRASPSNRPAMATLSILPANFSPALPLSSELLNSASFQPALQSQQCCTGNQCFRSKPYVDEECYECGPKDKLQATFCSDPFGSCWTPTYISIRCRIPETGKTFYCLQTEFSSCGSPGPSPSPPPPSPSPPPPAPTPCPLDCTLPPPAFAADPCSPDLRYLEGCPVGFNRSGNCCLPVPCPSPTPIAPACDGYLDFQPSPVCNWLCIPLPTPPTYQAYQYCSNYYLVTDYYISYDGGSTWSHWYSTTEYIGSHCLLTQ